MQRNTQFRTGHFGTVYKKEQVKQHRIPLTFMQFFDRINEQAALRAIQQQAEQSAQFTVVTGRRRIGKTSLLINTFGNDNMLYFFVTRSAESVLCETFRQEIEAKLHLPFMGNPTSFAELFEGLMRYSQQRSFTLVIDEFQEFHRVNSSIYSEMQRIWDLYHTQSKINLLVCGSVNSLMHEIFHNEKEPLFGRQTNFMHLSAFTLKVQVEILQHYAPNFSNEDLLALYTFTGGVPKYIELLLDNGACTKQKMINYIFKPDSAFLTEGKNLLIEEFGKDYGTYFSILSAISQGKTTRSEIENLLQREIGGYLTRLEVDFGLISRKQPMHTRSTTKSMRYLLKDNFLLFWFRFIHKYAYMLEIGNHDALKTIVLRDYDTFTGLTLERWFMECFAESKQFTRLGNWWDRKGENEIDLIAENELTHTVLFCEIKRQPANINLQELATKRDVFLRTTGEYADYTMSLRGLSLQDMTVIF